MHRGTALEQATHLLAAPSAARAFRAAPLPKDVDFLLRILARDPDAEARAIDASGRPIERIRDAAEFYADQILFAPDGDSYRTLAAEPGAPREQLRTNMALLMRWLHPDARPDEDGSLRFDRVMRAWDAVRVNRGQETVDTRRWPSPKNPPRSVSPSVRAPYFRTSQFRSPSSKPGRRSGRAIAIRRMVGVIMIALILFGVWFAFSHSDWFEPDWVFAGAGQDEAANPQGARS